MVKVARKSRNLWNEDLMFNATISSNINNILYFPFTVGENRKCVFLEVSSDTTYTMSFETTGDRLNICAYDRVYSAEELRSYTVDNQLSGTPLYISPETIPTTVNFTTNSDTKMIGVYYCLNTAPTNIMLNEGSTALTYEPHDVTIWEDCVPRVCRVGIDTFTTFPATIIANSDDMRQYQIWGNVGGVGDRTVNLLDKRNIESNTYVRLEGAKGGDNKWDIYYVTATNGEQYIATGVSTINSSAYIGYADANKNILGIVGTALGTTPQTVTMPEIGTFLAVSVRKSATTPMLTPGTTPPETFAPFGYKMDIGVKSGNVYNTAETAWSADNTLLDDSGNPIASSSHYTTNFTAVKPETTYYLSGTYRTNSLSSIRIYFYDESKCWISRSAKINIGATRAFMTPANCEFIQIQIDTNIRSTADWYIKEGTTPPDEYQPYINTTTPIYIGSDPLGEDEYVDYQAGKVYRRTAQLFDKSNFAQNATTHECEVAETATGIEFLATGYDPYVADTFSSGKNIAASPYWSFHQKLLIPVEENETYTIAASTMPKCYITYVNESYVSLSNVQISSKKYLFTTPNGCKFLLFRFGKQNVPIGSSYAFDDIILCKGTIDTPTYIPYLQPTDPPVVLPALPTCNWMTIVDYDGIAKPTEMYIKYNSLSGREDYVPRVLGYGTDTLTALPAKIYTNGLESKTVTLGINGNTVQNGTPTPDTPVAAEGCGTLDNGRYKIPVTLGEQTQDVYLDTVTTTRRIKKLVLTGEENWINHSGDPPNTFFIEIFNTNVVNCCALCTHYSNQDSGSFANLEDKHLIVRKSSSDGTKRFMGIRDSSFPSGYPSVADLKSYLAAQYAAGTPVTVWYVLAEPETTTVNEPLMKIGNYADSVSLNFTNVTPGEKEISVDTTVQPSSVVATHTGWHKPSEFIHHNDEWTTSNVQQLSELQSSLSSTPTENEDEDIEETEEEGNEYELEH